MWRTFSRLGLTEVEKQGKPPRKTVIGTNVMGRAIPANLILHFEGVNKEKSLTLRAGGVWTGGPPPPVFINDITNAQYISLLLRAKD